MKILFLVNSVCIELILAWWNNAFIQMTGNLTWVLNISNCWVCTAFQEMEGWNLNSLNMGFHLPIGHYGMGQEVDIVSK